MQVLCKTTSDSPDVCCTICGQGFVLLWDRESRAERALAQREILKTLRNHHHKLSGPNAHPQHGFVIPAWDGSAAYSGAAILGNAPSWAL